MKTGEKSGLQALLIVGPTGSGKTPIGNYLAGHGWNGRRCCHFDFGESLRAAGDGRVAGFGDDEIAFIREVLATGALLENETIPLAERILRSFTVACRVQPADLLVLNGLPRHVGQAAAIDEIVTIDAVIHLDCTPETVFERLRLNSGGDRSRTDDDFALVQEKLRIFAQRTTPLLAHYRDHGVEIHRLQVGVATEPAELLARIR